MATVKVTYTVSSPPSPYPHPLVAAAAVLE